MENKNFIYTPIWVRVLSIGALSITLVMSLLVTWHYLDTEKETWLLVAMSLAQVSASGLAFTLVVFYSSKDAGISGLQHKTNLFLCRVLPRTLLLIDFPNPAVSDWKKSLIPVKGRLAKIWPSLLRPSVFRKYRVAIRPCTLFMHSANS